MDFGFRRQTRMSSVEEFRLEGIDTPERSGATRAMGEAAKQQVRELLSEAVIIIVESLAADDKYGRWVARVKFALPGGAAIDLANQLIVDGYARPYDGKGKRLPWDPALPYPLIP